MSGVPPLHLRGTLWQSHPLLPSQGGPVRLPEGQVEQGGHQEVHQIQHHCDGRELQQCYRRTEALFPTHLRKQKCLWKYHQRQGNYLGILLALIRLLMLTIYTMVF